MAIVNIETLESSMKTMKMKITLIQHKACNLANKEPIAKLQTINQMKEVINKNLSKI